jgi:hypothetical protein
VCREDYIKIHEVGRGQPYSQIRAQKEWVWKFERQIHLEIHFLEKQKIGNLRGDRTSSPTSLDTLVQNRNPMVHPTGHASVA